MDVTSNLDAYLTNRLPTSRYVSFDYCFNYFQDHHEQSRLDQLLSYPNSQMSWLQLAFYLASWGMLRGSSTLLQKSAKHFEPVIQAIVDAPAEVWDVDADRYSREQWLVIDETSRAIRAAFPDGASDILVTKVMLGVFGCVPAFDTYFKKGFRVSTFGYSALKRVEQFYWDKQEAVERYRVQTIDFNSGAVTQRRYSRAKVIDMIFFIEGRPVVL